jgi:hypothetical protein
MCYSSFYVTTGTGTPAALLRRILALLSKIRTLIHEEISLLTVLYFPFRARTFLGIRLRVANCRQVVLSSRGAFRIK